MGEGEYMHHMKVHEREELSKHLEKESKSWFSRRQKKKDRQKKTTVPPSDSSGDAHDIKAKGTKKKKNSVFNFTFSMKSKVSG